MQIIKDVKSLNQAIAELENVQKSELNLLRQHFKFTVHSLNPVNILKEKFNETISSPNFKGEIIQGAIRLTTGFFTNRLIVGSSSSVVQKVLGSLIQKGISRLSIKTDSIKNSGVSVLKNVLAKMKIGN